VLNDGAIRYITLRRTLGYKLVKAERHLRAFARFAPERGETTSAERPFSPGSKRSPARRVPVHGA
jgi:hypothetical protein